jgi:uncharacterized protein (TIGR00255 family)
MDHLEADIRAQAREKLNRGSCFFALQKESESTGPRLSLNEEALALVVAAARRLASVEGIEMPSADGILAIPGVLQDRSQAPADEAAAERRTAAVLSGFAVAADALRAARSEEGRRLAEVLDGQLATIERLVQAAEVIAAEAPEILRARINDQVALLSTSGNLDPDRLHQEAVIAVTRADVREELDRLASHIAGARNLVKSGDAVGRRLDFLTQEFNREANTLCSKAFDARLTEIGVELKTVIDQMREQVQNLE